MVLDHKKLTILLAVALLVVVTLLSLGNYLLLDRSGRGQSLARWHGQVEDRARMLVEPFAQAVRRLQQARDDALARAQGQKTDESVLRFSGDVEQRADGTLRAKAARFDAQIEAGVFVAPGVEADEALKHRIVTMRDTVNLFGQSWLKEYPNLWFAGPERWLVAYFPEYPWAETLDAAFDPTGEPWYKQAASERNMKRAAVWGVAKRDVAGKSLVVSLSLPVFVDNQLVGVIGEDVPLVRLIESVAVAEHESGIVRLVVDGSDGIVALSGRVAEIVKAGAPLKPDKKMADIAAALDAVRAHSEATGAVEASGAILDSAGKRAIVYAKVASHPWVLVTIVPDAMLAGNAADSALLFSGLAVVAVALVVALVGVGIKRALDAPAHQIAQAESALKEVEDREKAAVKASEDLTRQLDDARKKSKALESEVAAAKAAAEAARAEAVAAARPSVAATAETAGSLAQPGEETVASLEIDTAAT